MKKLIVLIVLFFACNVQAIQPVLVRDAWTLGRWKLYIPCDDAGIYWVMVDMGFPVGDDVDKPNFCILGMMYGRSREGKTFRTYGATDWTETVGTWTNSGTGGTGDGDWLYRNDADAAESSGEFLVPAGHNEIILYVYDTDTGSDLTIDWNDSSTTGLDITSYSTDADAGGEVAVVLVAENANPDGVLKLRVTKAVAGTGRILGLQTWDTDKDAFPSAITGALADGNGIVHRMVQEDGATILPLLVAGGDSSVVQFGNQALGKAYEFAIAWAPDGSGVQFSGGGVHAVLATASMAPFTSSDATGPHIRVDSSDKGEIYAAYNDGDAPLQALLVGDVITMFTKGYCDYNNGATQDGADPDTIWQWCATAGQLTTAISMSWAAAADLDASQIYSAMMPFANSALTAGDYYVIPPSTTKNDLLSASTIQPAGSIATMHVQKLSPMVMTIFTTSIARAIMEITGDDKVYCRLRPQDFDGGINPTNSDTLIAAGGWRFSQGYNSAMPSLNVRTSGLRDRYDYSMTYKERSF